MYFAQITIFQKHGDYPALLRQSFGNTKVAAALDIYGEMLEYYKEVLKSLDEESYKKDDNEFFKAIIDEDDLDKRLSELLNLIESYTGDYFEHTVYEVKPPDLTIELYNAELLVKDILE